MCLPVYFFLAIWCNSCSHCSSWQGHPVLLGDDPEEFFRMCFVSNKIDVSAFLNCYFVLFHESIAHVRQNNISGYTFCSFAIVNVSLVKQFWLFLLYLGCGCRCRLQWSRCWPAHNSTWRHPCQKSKCPQRGRNVSNRFGGNGCRGWCPKFATCCMSSFCLDLCSKFRLPKDNEEHVWFHSAGISVFGREESQTKTANP